MNLCKKSHFLIEFFYRSSPSRTILFLTSPFVFSVFRFLPFHYFRFSIPLVVIYVILWARSNATTHIRTNGANCLISPVPEVVCLLVLSEVVCTWLADGIITNKAILMHHTWTVTTLLQTVGIHVHLCLCREIESRLEWLTIWSTRSAAQQILSLIIVVKCEFLLGDSNKGVI